MHELIALERNTADLIISKGIDVERSELRDGENLGSCGCSS